ncbi:MAG: N-6 DNA methylase [Actinobacteria bacterium]|uniref:site-specific DNA-methyltransferase (adenine-specific) n=1 Tax=freshwater metagenome TaxID=449393 RepID=A0A6J7B3E2_9ZZZZ|nr:N-6 DNA methylase [Actinomycetota bacterium]MSY35496.1 N-6 DNA methylase [Actinomycetota bacterium]MTA72338.1 N-6 DNA methylase [Actinomycetota bacterium]
MATERYSVHEAELLAKKYAKITSEKSFAQTFWRDVFQQLCGVDDLLATGIEFEYPVRSHESGTIKFIDVLWPGVVLVEHKSAGQSLDKAEQQARDYLISLEAAKRPPVIILSDFAKFRIVEVLAGKSVEFALGDLPQNIGRFEAIIGDAGIGASRVEVEADTKAANLMSELFVQFEKAGYTGHEVSVFLVRILFLLFGDDTAMWRRTDKGLFSDVVNNSSDDGNGLGAILQELFVTLNTARENRPSTLSDSMSGFPYINGGIFAEQLPNFNFNKSMRSALVAATQYDWSTISPAIFGSLFQSVRDAETRREMGEHYTSETNILRCINDLFLNDFYTRLHESWDSPQALKSFRMELGQYIYLDPACGSGNFLVVAYKRMRDIELRIIARLQELDNNRAQLQLDGSLGLQVHLGQFHGIEIDEWSASIARVAMFLADHQANLALEQITGSAPNRFPLTESAVIVNANALRTDWETVCPMNKNTFIMGNPPFFGTYLLSDEQREDTQFVWNGQDVGGRLDFVANWFVLAARQVATKGGRVALVSTNSISQGVQPATLWKESSMRNVKIDFAHQTFKWQNDASGVAAVHVVIIGFSARSSSNAECNLWTYPDIKSLPVLRKVSNINAYLVDGPDILIEARTKPLNPDVSPMLKGSGPTDGGFLSDINAEEAAEIRKTDPIAAKYLRRFVGARELIHDVERWCLWLAEAEPADVRASKEITARLESVKQMRLASKKAATRDLARTPHLFEHNVQPSTTYIAVPRHSSEDREYVPMAYFDNSVVASDALSIIPDAPLWVFAVLQSRPFNVWNKTVSGRIKSDTRISNTITYNTFPFPELNSDLRNKLTESVNAVLNAREKYKDSSLADLYESTSMPAELSKAHMNLDSDVLAAYGLKSDSSDADILETLFSSYASQANQK